MRSLWRAMRYLKTYRWQTAAIVGALLVGSGAMLAMPRLAQVIIDRGIAGRNMRLVIGLSLAMVAAAALRSVFQFAQGALSARYPNARHLAWPFVKPRARRPGATYLLFPQHPGSLRFKKTVQRLYYSPSLAQAIAWGFDIG